jgi:hypothetical protein
MNALDEIAKLKERKLALRERMREPQVKVGEIERKKRLPRIALHALDRLWHPIAFQIQQAAHQELLQPDGTWLKQGLQALEKEGRTIDLDEGEIRTYCNFSKTNQEDLELLSVFTSKLRGEMSYDTWIKRFNDLRSQFEREVEEIERECSPLRVAGLEMSAEIAQIDQRLKEITDAATAAISG